MNAMDSRRARFNIGNIVGDPFALATISICLVRCSLSWIEQVADMLTARMAHSFCSLDHRGCTEPLPQIRLVDIGLYALLHHWYHHCLRQRHCQSLQHRSMSNPIP
jgi:hypothetical protein